MRDGVHGGNMLANICQLPFHENRDPHLTSMYNFKYFKQFSSVFFLFFCFVLFFFYGKDRGLIISMEKFYKVTCWWATNRNRRGYVTGISGFLVQIIPTLVVADLNPSITLSLTTKRRYNLNSWQENEPWPLIYRLFEVTPNWQLGKFRPKNFHFWPCNSSSAPT